MVSLTHHSFICYVTQGGCDNVNNSHAASFRAITFSCKPFQIGKQQHGNKKKVLSIVSNAGAYAAIVGKIDHEVVSWGNLAYGK